MKKIAQLLLFVFVVFLATPTVVTYIDRDIDVSMAFTANEEENSSKTQPGFEYTLHDHDPTYTSIQFSQEQTSLNHSYKEGYRLVFLDVLSPPPKQA
ncbi:hypothetical protein FHG64_09045 [Antarcticibacterium flavum]|uniref:Uncharacterized protein n=1 Tax=Antarcticibacterium flavum TaxID=2058175 RepID=A0A5B7X210_9FLAO|nr:MULTISPECIES: hypothetical protein [Antarcticibacterium]QCY69526.1 hypothetical protein FHG64_09045 [Antarcticibacterium flavum]